VSSRTAVLWFRRDLRLGDNPALLAARDAGDAVLPVFVVDPVLWEPAGPVRQAYLLRSLDALEAQVGRPLVLLHGDPAVRVPEAAARAGASEVHVAADYGPYGRARDAAVEKALAAQDAVLVRTGSPYAVAPGRVRKDDGDPYVVFTPFSRAWAAHGWRRPASRPRDVPWSTAVASEVWPDEPELGDLVLPEAGEKAALARWRRFRDDGLGAYGGDRNRPDLDGTSRMSAHLKWGEVHPRTLLADVADAGSGKGPTTFRSELAWREFFADVLWHRPETAREYHRPEFRAMPYATGRTLTHRFDAWAAGRTGFPFVDAGMRQLRAEGWMHNRVRMVVASFLVKDLHVEWQHGARHFLHWLRDGDLASNNHGWQWVAGSGTDAAPYFRVFNPVTQGLRFDPDGAYVRRWVPELRGLDGAAAHEPWTAPDGLPDGYPSQVVDHGVQRRAALEAYQALPRRGSPG
jgi:deoxyribodipyrimidine photo-lyase